MAKNFSADYGFQNKHAFGLSWMQSLAGEKKEISACGCILGCLVLGFFSSDSYFISQDWSLQLTAIPVCVIYVTPRDSHTVLASVSPLVTQQLEDILTSYFTLVF